MSLKTSNRFQDYHKVNNRRTEFVLRAPPFTQNVAIVDFQFCFCMEELELGMISVSFWPTKNQLTVWKLEIHGFPELKIKWEETPLNVTIHPLKKV